MCFKSIKLLLELWGFHNHVVEDWVISSCNYKGILKGAFIFKVWEIHLFGPLDALSIHCVPLKHRLHLTQWCSVMSEKNNCLFNHNQCNNNFVQTERLRKWNKQKGLPHTWRILNKILLFLCIIWQRLFLWAFLSFDIKIRLAYLINPKPGSVAYFTIMKENYFVYTNKWT